MLNSLYKEVTEETILQHNTIDKNDSLATTIWKISQDREFRSVKQFIEALSVYGFSAGTVAKKLTELSSKDWFDFKNVTGVVKIKIRTKNSVRMLRVKSSIECPNTKKIASGNQSHPYYQKWKNIFRNSGVKDCCEEWKTSNPAAVDNFAEWIEEQFEKDKTFTLKNTQVIRLNKKIGYFPYNCTVIKKHGETS